MSRKRPAEEVIDFDLDGPGSAPSGGGNDGGPSNGGRRRRVGAAAAGWGLAEVLAECGLDPAAGEDDAPGTTREGTETVASSAGSEVAATATATATTRGTTRTTRGTRG